MSEYLQTGRPPAGSAARGLGATAAGIAERLVDVVTDRQALESGRLPKQLKDFVLGSHSMLATRQGMYFGASLLAAYYYSFGIALLCFVLLQLTEALDNAVTANVIRWNGEGKARAIRYRNQLLATSILSAMAVGVFALLVAFLEGHTWHFTPLFFVLAAGLFAAINNHQLPTVLYARLVVYGVVFMFIPIKDLWVVRPQLSSELWLQFFTVTFVLFFVIFCSIIFLQLYRTNLDRLDELRVERDRAHAAYEVKSQFVSVVSHELRTPLHSIMGSLSLLNTGKLADHPDRAQKMVEIAHSNSQRLSKLIDDLLDLQKLEAEQLSYDFNPVALTDVVNDAITSVQGVAEERGIELKFLNPAVKLVARADHSRIQQVLTNLLSNALKFSKPGGRIEIRNYANAGRVGIEVRDYGIGIPEGSRKLVFGKFHQIDSSDERNHEGSGLGLNIAQQIVNAHDGIIDYVSEVGEGTTFFVELPVFDD